MSEISESRKIGATTWNRVKAVFLEAVQLSPSQREPFIREKFGGDLRLGGEVRQLLKYDDLDDGSFEGTFNPANLEPVREEPAREMDELEPGTEIKSWRIVRKLGVGGMGTVYLAERSYDGDQELTHRAAIKIIRADANSASIAERLRQERRVLIQLDHPNIARFIEAGALEDGRPYFVLDYIDGKPIDLFCREQGLSLRAKLKLFCQVCSAVAYAHKRLVIHCDLKPSNMMVSADGIPRLLDFGISQLLVEDEDGFASFERRFDASSYTPRYASPEQVSGQEVTTATDIFSLGIVLYELVTGIHPFDEERLTTDPPRRVKGDLGKILAKALQKKPEDRYRSVEHFLDDVGSYLANRPVVARRATLSYRLWKYCWRKPSVPIAIGTVMLVSATALVGVIDSWRRVQRERDYALQQRELAASAAESMIGDLALKLETADGPLEGNRDLLRYIAHLFDQINSSDAPIGKDGRDPAASAAFLRAEVQVSMKLRTAMEFLGDFRGTVHQATEAEVEARKLVAVEPGNLADRLLLTEAILEKSWALGMKGNLSDGTADLPPLLVTLNELKEKTKGQPDLLRKIEVQRSLALDRMSWNIGSIRPELRQGLIAAAVQEAEQAYHADPGDPEAATIYADCLEDLAYLGFQTGHPDGFAKTIRKALDARHIALQRNPRNRDLQQAYELAVDSFDYLSGCFERPGSNSAIPRASINKLRRMCAADPNNIVSEDNLITGLADTGLVAESRGEQRLASELFKEGLERGKTLMRKGVDFFWLDHFLLVFAHDLSRSYAETGDLTSAAKNLEEFCQSLADRMDRDDTNGVDMLTHHGLTMEVRARIAAESGHWNEAQRLAIEASRDLKKAWVATGIQDLRFAYASSLVLTGKATCHLGDRANGIDCIEHGLRTLEAIRDGNRVYPSGLVLIEISKAEKDLQSFQENQNDPGGALAKTLLPR